ncbi:MAG: polysaccharide deacetylase family protein [Suipraeoptans sp.]
MAYKKYFTLSFDDGLEQDKKIIRILKENGMYGCTFNLNAGLLGRKKALGRIGEYGFVEKDDLNVLHRKHRLIHYVQQYRIPSDEIAQVYDGFEVASHAYLHENLKRISDSDLDICIQKDVETLKELTGQTISGFAYPFGAVSDKVCSVLKRNGIRYARTTMSSKSFDIPENLHKLAPTCWIGQKETFGIVKRFVEEEPIERDMMLYIWGHGYEFDFGTERNNWDNLKRICDLIGSADDIISRSNGEILIEQR